MCEPGEGVNRDRKARRKRIAWVAGSLLLTLLVLFGGLVAYVAAVNQVPPYTPPSVTLPVPNAFDDFAAAGLLAHETDDIQIRAGREPATAALRTSAAANREAIARLRAGFQHGYLTPPRYGAPGAFPELTRFRSLARVMCAEGLLHERQGNPAAAVRSYLDTIRLGVTVPRGGSLIHWLVGIAIQSIGLANLQRSIDHLDAPSAKYAAQQLLKMKRGSPDVSDALLVDAEWESAEMTAMFRKLRTLNDYRQFSGWFQSSNSTPASDAWGAARFILTPKARIIRNFRTYMTHMADISRQPYYARAALPPIPDDPYNQAVDPIFSQAGFSAAKEDALFGIVAVQLAARAYTLEHGGPPPTAQALVPGYLDKVPNDPFAPRPITLRIKNGMALVYSVGPDGVDDGGTSLKGVIVPGSKGDYLTVKAQR